MFLKKSKSIVSIMTGLMGLASIGGYAQGGVLAGLPAIYGPGTSLGVPVGETVNVNNDNVGIGNPNRISLTGIDVVGLGPIDISVPVANSPGASGTTEYFIELGSAVNKTEAAWNGFVIELGSGLGSEFLRLSDFAIPGVSGLDFDTPDRDPAVSSPNFLSITHDPDAIVFSEGIVQIGEFASGQNFFDRRSRHYEYDQHDLRLYDSVAGGACFDGRFRPGWRHRWSRFFNLATRTDCGQSCRLADELFRGRNRFRPGWRRRRRRLLDLATRPYPGQSR